MGIMATAELMPVGNFAAKSEASSFLPMELGSLATAVCLQNGRSKFLQGKKQPKVNYDMLEMTFWCF